MIDFLQDIDGKMMIVAGELPCEGSTKTKVDLVQVDKSSSSLSSLNILVIFIIGHHDHDHDHVDQERGGGLIDGQV